MIVQLTGTLVEVLPTHVVLDVGGVGYELGVSSSTAAALPQAGEAGVTVLTRLIVREDAMDLYGFATREERALFDRLVAISGVGPKLALSVLSTFSPAQLATVVATQDIGRMAQVPGVGKRKGRRLCQGRRAAGPRGPRAAVAFDSRRVSGQLRCGRGHRRAALHGFLAAGGRAGPRGLRGGRCHHHREGALVCAQAPGRW